MSCQVVLLGNHDWALFDPDGFNRAAGWRSCGPGSSSSFRRSTHLTGGRWEFSPSGREPIARTVTSTSTLGPQSIKRIRLSRRHLQTKMERIFTLVERYCFQGHTHVPGIFTKTFSS
jgi:hypothetical protein